MHTAHKIVPWIQVGRYTPQPRGQVVQGGCQNRTQLVLQTSVSPQTAGRYLWWRKGRKVIYHLYSTDYWDPVLVWYFSHFVQVIVKKVSVKISDGAKIPYGVLTPSLIVHAEQYQWSQSLKLSTRWCELHVGLSDIVKKNLLSLPNLWTHLDYNFNLFCSIIT